MKKVKKNKTIVATTGTEQKTNEATFASVQPVNAEHASKLQAKMTAHLERVKEGFLAAKP